MTNTNKIELNELAKEIRNRKQSRKLKSPTHGDYTSSQIEDIPLLSFEARLRSITQGLLNRKYTSEMIRNLNTDELEAKLSEYGIESSLRDETPRINPESILRFFPEEEEEKVG